MVSTFERKIEMGTWGPGNFENDTAAEYLCDLCEPLVEQIRRTIADSVLMEPDEPESEVMIANVEILSVLAETIGRMEKGWVGGMVFPFPFPFPAPEEVGRWKESYLAVWDNYIDELQPEPDYKRRRREVIVTTFNRFILACKSGPPNIDQE